MLILIADSRHGVVKSLGHLGNGGSHVEGDGRLLIGDSQGEPTIIMHGGAGGACILGSNSQAGTIQFTNKNNLPLSMELEGGADASIKMRDDEGKDSIQLNAADHEINISNALNDETITLNGKYAKINIGGNKRFGQLDIGSQKGKTVISISGFNSTILLGGNDLNGNLVVRNKENKTIFSFDAKTGNLILSDTAGRQRLKINAPLANLELGGDGEEGSVFIKNNAGNDTVVINGETGDIILRNADIAEQFDIAEKSEVSFGSVMVLASDGALIPCNQPYDKRVIGVIAGAGRFKPGLVMDQHAETSARRLPIAMVGKTACRVDAGFGPVAVGDLLTTSPTKGCAMRASNPQSAFGAVIGKALTPLEQGIGFVDLIISLQ